MFARVTNEREMIDMSEHYGLKINGNELFTFGTLANMGSVHDAIKRRVPDATVDVVMPDGETLVNPTFPEALDFLARKGFTVLDKAGNPPAKPEPEKVAPVRKATARTTTVAATRKPTTPRKKVAAAATK